MDGEWYQISMKHISPLLDKNIRPALKTRLHKCHKKEPETVILDELGICRGESRVDVVLVNGSIHGFEIKSDRDSLQRLSSQIKLYSKVLDRATLVVGERHLHEAVKILPKWWGVLYFEATKRGPRFKNLKRAKKNPERNSRILAELLWRDDSVRLLEQYGLDRGVRGKPRCVIWDRICSNLDIEVIASAVRASLKARANSTVGP